MNYRCPRCKNEDIIEYEEFIECPKCNLDFDIDLGLINKEDLRSFNSIAKAINKIESIFKEQSVNQITMHRKYLPEIFDGDLLEISDSDGLPTLKSVLVNHLWMNGIITKFYGNMIRLIRF